MAESRNLEEGGEAPLGLASGRDCPCCPAQLLNCAPGAALSLGIPAIAALAAGDSIWHSGMDGRIACVRDVGGGDAGRP